MLRTVTATRYVTPLREGGSLPGLMEADDLGTYVVKFRGAGQGRKALIAEVISGRLAQTLGLPVPDLATADVDPILAANEPDEEVQQLLRASAGRNLAMDYLPGALDFDPDAFDVGSGFAGQVIWFDALIHNVDRSWRNPNMLFWHARPYLIDHGASLTFHHNWASAQTSSVRSYDASTHVLLGRDPDLDAADAALAPLATERALRAAAADVPDEWLADEPGFATADAVRDAYVDLLLARVSARAVWLAELRAAVAAHPGEVERRAAAVRAKRPIWLGGAG